MCETENDQWGTQPGRTAKPWPPCKRYTRWKGGGSDGIFTKNRDVEDEHHVMFYCIVHCIVK